MQIFIIRQACSRGACHLIVYYDNEHHISCIDQVGLHPSRLFQLAIWSTGGTACLHLRHYSDKAKNFQIDLRNCGVFKLKMIREVETKMEALLAHLYSMPVRKARSFAQIFAVLLILLFFYEIITARKQILLLHLSAYSVLCCFFRIKLTYI